MGFIRHFLLTIAGGLFLVLLISMNICYTIDSSLEYNTLRPSVISLSEDILVGSDGLEYIDKEIDTIRNYCKANSEINYNFEGNKYVVECEKVLESPDAVVESIINQSNSKIIEEDIMRQKINENYGVFVDYCEPHSELFVEDTQKLEIFQEEISVDSIKIDCDVADNNSEDILKNIISNYFDEIYYKNYDCEFSVSSLFFDCFLKYKSPFFLVSEQSKNYWYNKFMLLLVINITLAGAMFLFIEKKSNWFFVIGIFSLISSLPFFNIDWLIFILDNKYLEIYKIFITQHYQTFLMFFLFGIIMIGLGIGFKFFKLGFYISGKIDNLSKRFKKRKKDSSEKEISSEDNEEINRNKKYEKDKKTDKENTDSEK